MMEDGLIEWGDGFIFYVNEDRSVINYFDGILVFFCVDGIIIDSDG